MKQEQPDPLLRLHSAAIGAPKRAKPVAGPQPTHPICAAMGRAYWVEADARLAREQAKSAGAVSAAPFEWPEFMKPKHQRLPQPDADGWIPFECTEDSVCPVPEGVEFEVRYRDGSGGANRRAACFWTAIGPCTHMHYRILPAKPAALPGWRKGMDVPEAERVGLWFSVAPHRIRPAQPARLLGFLGPSYRPAPPGVKEGDAYDPKLYGEEA